MIAENPRLEATIFGALFGAIGGFAIVGWEAAVIGWLRLGVPAPSDGLWWVAASVVVGAVGGGLLGMAGLTGQRWAIVAICSVIGWCVAGSVGAPVWALAALGLAVGGVVRRRVRRGRRLARWSAILACILAWALIPWLYVGPNLAHPVAWLGGALAATATVGVVQYVRRNYESGIFPVACALGAYAAAAWAAAWPVAGKAPLWPAADRLGTPVVLVTVGGFGRDLPPMPEWERWSASAVHFSEVAPGFETPRAAIASLLTGNPRHGAERVPWTGVAAIRSDVPSLPELLAAGGYATAAVVGTPDLSGRNALFRGFDRYDDGAALPPLLVRPFLGAPARTDVAVLAAARDFVARQVQGRWFLWVDVPGGLDASVAGFDRELSQFLSELPRAALVVVSGTGVGTRPGSVWIRGRAVRAPGVEVSRPVAVTDIAPSVLASLYFPIDRFEDSHPFPELGAPDSPLASNAVSTRGAAPWGREIQHWLARTGHFRRPAPADPESDD
jgi:hypothetical protein